MKVNKMIGRAMSAAVAATMLLGSTTVLADETNGRPRYYTPSYETRDTDILAMYPACDVQRLELTSTDPDSEAPAAHDFDEEDNDDTRLPVLELVPIEGAPSHDPSEYIPLITIDNSVREPEAEEAEEEEEEEEEAGFKTGDIIRATREETRLPDGVYRVYFSSRDYHTFTGGSYYIRNGKLIVNMRGISISVGDYLAGFRIIVSERGVVELHPVNANDIAMYEEAAAEAAAQEQQVPEQETEQESEQEPQQEIQNSDTSDDNQNPFDQTPSNTITPVDRNEPVNIAPTNPVSSSAPASSAPATMVAGAARSGIEGFVDRLYVNALNRSSDSQGRSYWINLLSSKTKTGTEVANGFFNSVEFTGRNLNNEQFVTTLYKVFFDRQPDESGLNNWVNALNNGASRAQVIAGFTSSSEWNDTCSEFGINA